MLAEELGTLPSGRGGGGHGGCFSSWHRRARATRRARAATEGSSHVEFRCVALIPLWTLLVGPVADPPPKALTRPVRTQATVKVPAGAATPAPVRSRQAP